MMQKDIAEMKVLCHDIANFYNIENLENEVEVWYNVWKEKNLVAEDLKRLDLVDVYEEAKEFFPSIKHALEIALALPCTTANVERSFSTLRKVKTWLRSTMSEDRLNGKNWIFTSFFIGFYKRDD